MDGTALLLPILVPSLAAAVVFALPERLRSLRDGLFVFAGLANLFAVLQLMSGDFSFSAPWASKWFEFSLLATPYAKFTIAAAAAIVFLIVLYTAAFMRGKAASRGFAALTLFTLGFVNGAVLADNLIVFLFFWEGLMLPLFGMIAMGGRDSFRTAIKAFVINGVADLCMMVGIVIVMMLAGTATISGISLQTSGVLPGAAFLLMLAGALAKAGCMPFHSWIPDAAKDAPLPFMALFPGAIEKLLGIYLVARLSFDIFSLEAASYISTMMMIVGSATILFAVLMALIQKDFKRLLSFHAISQVGYMVLGIGTATPVGIVGGIFHMFNNAIYKSCLFLTGGAVERQTGTTDLRKLGGLARKMPVTWAGFAIAALSISGVPPFNGFFSKELVYDGALARHWIFYAAALAGSFFTAASFLKLGHAAFLGKRPKELDGVKEAPPAMLLGIVLLAAGCVLFGLWNSLPLDRWIAPILGDATGGAVFGGFHVNILWYVTVGVLLAAVANHIYGVKKTGAGLGAVDHIYHAPVAEKLYGRAEEGFFDPYRYGLGVVGAVARAAWLIDRWIDSIYDVVTVRTTLAASRAVRAVHDGSHTTYLAWSLGGAAVVAVYLLWRS